MQIANRRLNLTFAQVLCFHSLCVFVWIDIAFLHYILHMCLVHAIKDTILTQCFKLVTNRTSKSLQIQ
jgi:hypothetical protein